MIQVTFTLRTVTPLFLAGADQENRAELRAPTFRGLMRYWYRALIGGMVGTNEEALVQVIQAEKLVFGATDTGSAVSIRVSDPSKAAERFTREGFTQERATGKDYLLWSMGRNKYRSERLFFPQNTTFCITFTSKGNDHTKIQQAIAAFWLLIHLGGIGARSRRCAGSLTAQIFDEDMIKPLRFIMPEGLHFGIPEGIKDLQSQLNTGVKAARALVGKNLNNINSTQVTQANFDALAQRICRIWILSNDERGWDTPDAAMRVIGSSMRIHRSDFTPHECAIFGLPLKGVSDERRASPLLLRITELQGNKYVGIAVLFKTGGNNVNVGDYRIIEEWVNGFSKKLEVML